MIFISIRWRINVTSWRLLVIYPPIFMRMIRGKSRNRSVIPNIYIGISILVQITKRKQKHYKFRKMWINFKDVAIFTRLTFCFCCLVVFSVLEERILSLNIILIFDLNFVTIFLSLSTGCLVTFHFLPDLYKLSLWW